MHGNIEALKAAHNAVNTLKVDKIYHLGDLGGYAPFVNEVVDFLMEHKIEGVQGNYDFNVASNSEHCGCKYEDAVQAEFAQKSFEWTKARTSPESKEYMRNLPAEISFSAHGKRVKLFHATPHKNNLYWYEDRPDKFFLQMAEKTDADLMVYGHTHKPYRKDIMGKIFINAGSVGKPKDGDTRTCVALINIADEGIKSKFFRIPYDVEKTVQTIRESGLPAYFADKLREGR
ncbi:MAG: YfcE family phosphodiesterase [bacterium]